MALQIYCGKGFDTQKAERFFKERRIPYQRVDVLRYGIVRCGKLATVGVCPDVWAAWIAAGAVR